MSFYRLVHQLYPEYIPPNKFVYPMKNKFSLFVQLVLQKQKKLQIFKLLKYKDDLEMYQRVSSVHNILARFVTRTKFIYAKHFNDTNLYGDPLKKLHVSIIENNKIYKFDYFEMFKLIKEKIYYHEHYFLLPMMPTNPYTNIPFGMHNLYNIYLQMLSSTYIIPPGIRYLFSVNFNLDKFIDKYSYNILLDVISAGYNKMPILCKYDLMRDMFIYYKKIVFLNVPCDKLYEIFHKQVFEYYKSLNMPDWCARLIVFQLREYIQTYHKMHPNIGKVKKNMFTNSLIANF